MKLSPCEIAYVAAHAGFIGDDLPVAVAVALAESSGDTDILSPANTGTAGNRDHGLMQISSQWHGAKLQQHPNWRDPYENMMLAKLVFDERKQSGKIGWTAWSVYNSIPPLEPAYKKFMTEATLAVNYPFPPVTLAETVSAELSERWKE